MKARDSLRRRISVAYLLFTLGSTAFFATICAIAVEGIEMRLVDARLKEVAIWASPRQASGLPVAMLKPGSPFITTSTSRPRCATS
ncbi:hypothetical protein LP419_13710 [Massilia sp. H-1]|nr:hypothetical protein LP419_13710 [Massilia sp. H-1]